VQASGDDAVQASGDDAVQAKQGSFLFAVWARHRKGAAEFRKQARLVTSSKQSCQFYLLKACAAMRNGVAATLVQGK
jgi:hypothetical protein